MTMSTLWSNELELKLLECFQDESVLWDSKNPMYKDKTTSNNAWARISSFMGIPVQDLKRKRDSLLSSYRKYKKLIKDSMHPGADASEIYKPVWFAYDFIDSFLGEVQSGKKTNKKDRGDDPLRESEDDDNPPRTAQIIDSQPKNRRKNVSDLEQAGSYIKDAVNTLNTALKRKESPSENCDLYGKIIANKLRKFSEIEQAEIMYEIDGIFLGRFSNPSQALYDPSPSPSPYSYVNIKRRLSSESSYSENVQKEVSYPVYQMNTPTSNEELEIHPEIITIPKSEVTDSLDIKPIIQTKKTKRNQ